VEIPVDSIGARAVARPHPVGMVVVVERMAAQPHVPQAVVPQDDGVLHPREVVSGQHRPSRTGIEPGGIGRLEEVDPPVVGPRGGATDIDPPPAAGHGHQGGALEGLTGKGLPVERRQRLEVFAVGGPGHHVGEAPALPEGSAEAVAEVDAPVGAEGGARPPGPVSRTLSQGFLDDDGAGRIRHREQVRLLQIHDQSVINPVRRSDSLWVERIPST
jgi:hypothetical protein